MNSRLTAMLRRTQFGALLAPLFAAALCAEGADAPLESPFHDYLGSIAETGGQLQARFAPVAKAMEGPLEGEAPFAARRAQLGGEGAPVQGRQTIVAVQQGERAYLFDYVQFEEKVEQRGLELVYPLGDYFYPVTWEFQDDSGDWQSDLLLYDRRQFPEEFAGAYGINQITTNQVRMPAGAPLLRVRVLASEDGPKDFASWPVIRTSTEGRTLVIPVPVGQSDLRVLFFPERFRQSPLTSIISTDYSKMVLRFRAADDSYQFGAEGAKLAIEHQPAEGAPIVLNAGIDYVKAPEPSGELLAYLDFESVDSATTSFATPAAGGQATARLKAARVVDAGVLAGQALYLGERRIKSNAGITLPASIRAGLTRDQFTFSAWIKLPWGQLGRHQLVNWPFRRPVEGISPFTTDWTLAQLGGLQMDVRRWDRGDGLVLRGFGNQLNEATSLEIGPPGWQHVAISVNGESARVYHNGVIKGDVRMPQPITAASLQSGGDLELFKNFWGMLDNVRLHNYALSEKQVGDLMRSDTPDLLLRYRLDELAGGMTPSTPSGEFPVDAWSWETHNFKPEATFAAEAKGAERVADGVSGGSALRVGRSGVLVPPKATLDLGMDRIAVAFWFRPDEPGGQLLNSRGHIKYGFRITYNQNGLGGVVCNGWNLPAYQPQIATGEWHHFAFCYDNYEMRIFLNGELVKSAIYIPEESLNLVDGLAIAEGMKGLVDDIRVFGRMLSEEDVKKLVRERSANP